MTRWSDWWLEIARKHFPKTPIYLCTGGDASPPQGSNFAEQCRVAARHNAGVRITNEASQYALNCALTRWVASAGKHYGAYYGFEPAGGVDESGIVARIYNATASGADQLFEYNSNVVSAKPRLDIQRANLKTPLPDPSDRPGGRVVSQQRLADPELVPVPRQGLGIP